MAKFKIKMKLHRESKSDNNMLIFIDFSELKDQISLLRMKKNTSHLTILKKRTKKAFLN